MGKPTAAEIADQNARTTPLGLVGRAIEHYACAVAAFDAVGDHHSTWTPSGQVEPVAPDGANHLLAMSIEVALKAYLREKGLGVYEIRTQFGHDLVKLLERAEKEGLVGPKANDRALLSLLNDLFLSREFEFTVAGYRRFPAFNPIREVAFQIFDEVFDAIASSRNFLNSKAGAFLKRDMPMQKRMP